MLTDLPVWILRMVKYVSDAQSESSAIVRKFNERLSEDGLKTTRQRDLIVERFFALNTHISVEELLEDVRRQAPRIGYATVYRTLKLLVEYRFAEPRQFGDNQTRFDPVFGDDHSHDHLICIDCRRVMEFADEVVNARVKQIVGEHGTFVLQRQRLELYARCTNQVCPHRG
jgi:Fur family ferric uptake transcriptional regulator